MGAPGVGAPSWAGEGWDWVWERRVRKEGWGRGEERPGHRASLMGSRPVSRPSAEAVLEGPRFGGREVQGPWRSSWLPGDLSQW